MLKLQLTNSNCHLKPSDKSEHECLALLQQLADSCSNGTELSFCNRDRVVLELPQAHKIELLTSDCTVTIFKHKGDLKIETENSELLLFSLAASQISLSGSSSSLSIEQGIIDSINLSLSSSEITADTSCKKLMANCCDSKISLSDHYQSFITQMSIDGSDNHIDLTDIQEQNLALSSEENMAFLPDAKIFLTVSGIRQNVIQKKSITDSYSENVMDFDTSKQEELFQLFDELESSIESEYADDVSTTTPENEKTTEGSQTPMEKQLYEIFRKGEISLEELEKCLRRK